MTARGESIYKASERIRTYGVEAFVKMLGKKAIKARGGRARLLKYYAAKYPEAPITLEPKGSYISRTMRSYWKDVKSLSETRNLSIKDTRKLLKNLKTDKNVQVRIIKEGEGWQYILFGKYEHWDKDEMSEGRRDNDKKHEIEDQVGYSYVHSTDEYYEEEEDAFEEAKNDARAVLGGSGWQLIKILKETWVRYYGRLEK